MPRPDDDREDRQDREDVAPTNAFDPAFLDRFGRKEQPPSVEADTAGPWRVEPVDGGWGCFAEGEAEPEAVFAEREMALLAAAAFPASGAAARFKLVDRERPPFPVAELGEPAGRVRWWRDELVTAMNHLGLLLHQPTSLAHLLEAAGAITLERVGKILESRVGEEG